MRASAASCCTEQNPASPGFVLFGGRVRYGRVPTSAPSGPEVGGYKIRTEPAAACHSIRGLLGNSFGRLFTSAPGKYSVRSKTLHAWFGDALVHTLTLQMLVRWPGPTYPTLHPALGGRGRGLPRSGCIIMICREHIDRITSSLRRRVESLGRRAEHVASAAPATPFGATQGRTRTITQGGPSKNPRVHRRNKRGCAGDPEFGDQCPASHATRGTQAKPTATLPPQCA